jgi:hypothetical protein
MRYDITEQDRDVEIHLHDAAGRTSELLGSMQDCQQGRCGCPTDQYDRLAGMDVEATDDEVTVRLQPKTGERFDTDELRACLDYTIEHIAQD